MITSTVQVHDSFGEINVAIDRKTVRGLNDAARAAADVAEQKSGNIAEWNVIPAHGTANGFASGIKASNPLPNVFDKGSLGKRTARLKDPRRKEDWRVVRKGSNPYTAHRRDVAGKGVAARNIRNPARTAGRKILNASVAR